MTSSLVQQALDREYVHKTYPTFRCFVPGCTHIEMRERLSDETQTKSVTNRVQFFTCPKHGTQCTRCWEVVENDDDVKQIHLTEECRGLPKEWRNDTFKETLRRCPNCQEPIERTEGCDHMKCSLCNQQFNWQQAPSFAPVAATNSNKPNVGNSSVRNTANIASGGGDGSNKADSSRNSTTMSAIANVATSNADVNAGNNGNAKSSNLAATIIFSEDDVAWLEKRAKFIASATSVDEDRLRSRLTNSHVSTDMSNSSRSNNRCRECGVELLFDRDSGGTLCSTCRDELNVL